MSSLADLQSQLAEVELAISELTGAVDLSVGGFSSDMDGSYRRLVSQRSDLQLRISVLQGGGQDGDNCAAAAFGVD